MNPVRFPLIFAIVVTLGTPLAAQEPSRMPDCSDVVKKLEADISAEPSKLLLAVENAITINVTCACEIIRTAIVVSKADEELAGEIVFAAVTAAPSEAARILECALQAAPGATAAIRNAMQRALGDKALPAPEEKAGGRSEKTSGKEPAGKEVVARPAGGKEPAGKEQVGEEEVIEDFGPVGPTGIYLMPLVSTGIRTIPLKPLPSEDTVIVRIVRPRRLVPPVTVSPAGP